MTSSRPHGSATRQTGASLVVLLSLAFGSCGSPQAVPTSPTIAGTVAHVPQPIPEPIPGASQVNGVVYDTAYRPVGGARVEVLDGPQAALSAISDSKGEFSLTGVFDDTTRFRATGDGYLPETEKWGPFCAPCHPNHWIFFTLGVTAPSANIAGEYTLTFVADGACSALPDELRVRTYAATVAPLPTASDPQGSSLFQVSMKGVPFLENYSTFRIGVVGDYLGFPDDDGATLVESLGPDTYLSYEAFGLAGGQVVGATAGPTITTTIAAVDYCVTKSPYVGHAYYCDPNKSSTRVECVGTNRLTLTRR